MRTSRRWLWPKWHPIPYIVNVLGHKFGCRHSAINVVSRRVTWAPPDLYWIYEMLVLWSWVARAWHLLDLIPETTHMYDGSNGQHIWQWLKSNMDYKVRPSRDLPNDAFLPDELNAFYTCFDKNNTELCTRTPTIAEDWVISLSEADMSNVFNLGNIRKATGPTGIPRYLLRAC